MPKRTLGPTDVKSMPLEAAPTSAGAIWRRVDLHLHSPGVSTFSCPSGMDYNSSTDREKLIERYVAQLVTQRISICAITDYNGVRTEWFVPIRDAAAQKGIKMLPGAEVSFKAGKYGLHILAIFPEETDPSSINSFLQSFDRDAATPLFDLKRTHRDIDPNHNVADLLVTLRERFRCLLIPPHPDQENGICKSLQPSDAARLLTDVHPDAIEHCPNSEIQKLRSTGVSGIDFLDRLAILEFSDPRCIEDIGTRARKNGQLRATYLKLSASDIDALRLALHDPETRLSLGGVPISKHARIRTMEVTGSGFLGNITIAWNDDLNVLIGGRGTGKSAILETLRYALGLEPYSEASYRNELVHHALGSGGKVAVVVDLPIGLEKVRSCRIARVWGEDPRVYEFDTERPTSLRPYDLFGSTGTPTIFGQREIYAVSGSEDYRLRLLDDLIGEEANQRAKEVEEVLQSLQNNARSIMDIRQKLAKRDEYRQRLKTIEHDIAVYERYGVAEKLKTATALGTDGQYLRGAVESVERAAGKWSESAAESARQLESSARNLQKGQSVQKSILQNALETIAKLDKGIRELAAKGEELFQKAKSDLGKIRTQWQEGQKPLEEELNKIKQEVQTDKLDPDRLLHLNEERASIAPEIEELDRAELQLKTLVEFRLSLLSKVRNTCHKEYELRRERADSISKFLQKRLRLGVEFKGQKEEYKKRLLTLLKGSGVSADAVERLVVPDATDGITLAEAIRGGASQVQDRFGLTFAMAERLIRWFTENELRLFELESLIPRDALRVDLRVEGGTRPLEHLSPGQRATAILLLLFAQHGRILILDQPEDD